MRVLLTGATGLIGSAVLARLRDAGHEIVAVSRSAAAARRLPEGTTCVALDIGTAVRPADWLAHLAGIEAVVSCAGVLQDSPRDSTAGVHIEGASALFAACEQAGVRRIVHLSAVGVDRDASTAFARSKYAGDERLMASRLDWVILRPSVVVGRAAYGGSALFRGLAALPVIPRVAGSGPLQVVQLDDVVRTVLFFLDPKAPARVALEIAGPERLPLDQILSTYRCWLGRDRARFVSVPGWLAGAMFRLGDMLGLLGWRPPLRTTVRCELARGAVGDPAEWMRLTGIEPRSLAVALAGEPASVQERWFARLYFLKPVALSVLSLFWIVTGLIALGPGWRAAAAIMQEAGAAGAAALLVAAGAVADIGIGAAIAVQRTARRALQLALAVACAYAVLGAILLPRLLSDPLGALLKIMPIVVLHVIALAILDDR